MLFDFVSLSSRFRGFFPHQQLHQYNIVAMAGFTR